jgi:hypothetical protein
MSLRLNKTRKTQRKPTSKKKGSESHLPALPPRECHDLGLPFFFSVPKKCTKLRHYLAKKEIKKKKKYTKLKKNLRK